MSTARRAAGHSDRRACAARCGSERVIQGRGVVLGLFPSCRTLRICADQGALYHCSLTQTVTQYRCESGFIPEGEPEHVPQPVIVTLGCAFHWCAEALATEALLASHQALLESQLRLLPLSFAGPSCSHNSEQQKLLGQHYCENTACELCGTCGLLPSNMVWNPGPLAARHLATR